MELDVEGRIYAAAGTDERSGIYVLSPEGELLEFIHVPEFVTNCAFGGTSGRRLFVTAGTSLYTIELRHTGFVRFPSFTRKQ